MTLKSLRQFVFALLVAIAIIASPPFVDYWRVAGLYEICWYRWWWVLFIAIAYSSTRYLGWFGFIATVLIVSVVIMVIDVHWIFDDMRNHPENGRDADFVFGFGVLCRIILFNLLLVPVGILGRRIRARRRQLVSEPKAI